MLVQNAANVLLGQIRTAPIRIEGGWRVRSTNHFHVDVHQMLGGNLRVVTTPVTYVERRLTTREVAGELGVGRNTVIRRLAAAGIARRPRAARRPRGARAAVTDEALAEVYRRPGMTVRGAAAHFGVSVGYLGGGWRRPG